MSSITNCSIYVDCNNGKKIITLIKNHLNMILNVITELITLGNNYANRLKNTTMTDNIGQISLSADNFSMTQKNILYSISNYRVSSFGSLKQFLIEQIRLIESNIDRFKRDIATKYAHDIDTFYMLIRDEINNIISNSNTKYTLINNDMSIHGIGNRIALNLQQINLKTKELIFIDTSTSELHIYQLDNLCVVK